MLICFCLAACKLWLQNLNNRSCPVEDAFTSCIVLLIVVVECHNGHHLHDDMNISCRDLQIHVFYCSYFCHVSACLRCC